MITLLNLFSCDGCPKALRYNIYTTLYTEGTIKQNGYYYD